MDTEKRTASHRNPDGTFVKGNKEGGGKAGVEHVPPLLRVLRWAFRNADSEKKGTRQQERFRQMFRDRPDEFITLFRQMEREHKPKKEPAKVEAAAQPVAQPEEDVGSDRALSLVRRWLQERQGAGPPPG